MKPRKINALLVAVGCLGLLLALAGPAGAFQLPARPGHVTQIQHDRPEYDAQAEGTAGGEAADAEPTPDQAGAQAGEPAPAPAGSAGESGQAQAGHEAGHDPSEFAPDLGESGQPNLHGSDQGSSNFEQYLAGDQTGQAAQNVGSEVGDTGMTGHAQAGGLGDTAGMPASEWGSSSGGAGHAQTGGLTGPGQEPAAAFSSAGGEAASSHGHSDSGVAGAAAQTSGSAQPTAAYSTPGGTVGGQDLPASEPSFSGGGSSHAQAGGLGDTAGMPASQMQSTAGGAGHAQAGGLSGPGQEPAAAFSSAGGEAAVSQGHSDSGVAGAAAQSSGSAQPGAAYSTPGATVGGQALPAAGASSGVREGGQTYQQLSEANSAQANQQLGQGLQHLLQGGAQIVYQGVDLNTMQGVYHLVTSQGFQYVLVGADECFQGAGNLVDAQAVTLYQYTVQQINSYTNSGLDKAAGGGAR